MRIRKAVIPAAGFGTRVYPASKAVKKELFPVVGPDGVCRPAIQYNVDELVAAGVEQICLVVQPGDEGVFQGYFSAPSDEMLAKLKPEHAAHSQRLAELGRTIAFARQETPEGYGHAVYCAREFIGDEPFILLLGDHVFRAPPGPSCAEQLIQVQAKYGCAVTAVCRVGADQLPHLAAIAGQRLPDDPRVIRVEEFREKPEEGYAREHLRVAGLAPGEWYGHFGMHAFTPGIFDALQHLIDNDLREGREFQLTAAQQLLATRETYYACEIAGERHDIGLPAEYVRTVQSMARPL